MRFNPGISFVRTVVLGCAIAPLMVSAADPKPTTKPSTAKPAAATPTKPAAISAEARKNSAKAISTCIATCTKEYQAYAKDPANVKLRDKANYFVENKEPALTDELLLTALSNTIVGDAPADAYIKWQLTSGMSEKVDEKLIKPLYMVYSNAPVPLHRPGMTMAEKQELDALIKGVKNASQEQIVAFSDKIRPAVDAWEARNMTVLAYRDALRSRMVPNSVEEFAAYLEDMHSRVMNGIDVEPLMKNWIAAVKTWANNSPPQQQTQYLAGALLKIIDEMGGKSKKPSAAVDRKDTVLASALSPDRGEVVGDNVEASVILAAKGGYTPPGGYGNMGKSPTAGKEFPPKYYVMVEFDTKTNALKWIEASAKFADKDKALVPLQELLAAPLQPMQGPLNMKPGK
jgi:hypothetical protein